MMDIKRSIDESVSNALNTMKELTLLHGCLEDMRQAATVEACRSMAKKKEESISKALDIKLGEGCWSNETFLGNTRLTCSSRENRGDWDHYQLDGEPLVSFGPVEMTQKPGPGVEVSFSMKIYFHVKDKD